MARPREPTFATLRALVLLAIVLDASRLTARGAEGLWAWNPPMMGASRSMQLREAQGDATCSAGEGVEGVRWAFSEGCARHGNALICIRGTVSLSNPRPLSRLTTNLSCGFYPPPCPCLLAFAHCAPGVTPAPAGGGEEDEDAQYELEQVRQRAGVFHQRGEYDEALKLWTKAIAADPTVARSYTGR